VLSAVGDDAGGRCVRRALRAAGVSTRRLVASARTPTTVAVVIVDARGERRFLVPDRRALERRAPAFDLSPIDAHTLVLVDGHFPAQALRALRRARACGASVIGDFHRPSPAVRRLLPYVDYPIVPLEFALAGGDADPRAALRRLARGGARPVVTLGRRGGIYLDEGERVRRYRALPVKVVDTTGAGDVFHGAFAAGLYHGLPFEAALELAARAAAKNCGALGGAGRLMTRVELRRAMRRRAALPGSRGR
jgi:sulfofructose kinase